MAGFIYIMSNPAFPNLLKIGKSKKDPTTDRVNELNQTGVPEPFKVEYYAFVENEDYLERVIHQEFAAKRPNKSREFFSIDCNEAIHTIRRMSAPHSKIKYEEVFFLTPEEIAKYEWEQEQLQRVKEEAFECELKAQAEEAERLRVIQETQDRKRLIQERIEAENRLAEETKNDWFFKLTILALVCLFSLAKTLSD